jgi:cystathionine beta-lyase
MSLAVPYEMGPMRHLGWAQGGPLVRFAVGLERVEDLQADLDQALGATLRIG